MDEGTLLFEISIFSALWLFIYSFSQREVFTVSQWVPLQHT